MFYPNKMTSEVLIPVTLFWHSQLPKDSNFLWETWYNKPRSWSRKACWLCTMQVLDGQILFFLVHDAPALLDLSTYKTVGSTPFFLFEPVPMAFPDWQCKKNSPAQIGYSTELEPTLMVLSPPGPLSGLVFHTNSLLFFQERDCLNYRQQSSTAQEVGPWLLDHTITVWDIYHIVGNFKFGKLIIRIN